MNRDDLRAFCIGAALTFAALAAGVAAFALSSIGRLP